MMVFTFGSNGRYAFYRVKENGVVTVSQQAYGGREMISAVSVKDIPSLVSGGHFKPYNLKAAIYAKEIAIKSRNRHLAFFALCVAVSVASILLGVWS